MPKILIVSDTHGLKKEVNAIKERHADVDAMIHCGDSELSFDSNELEGFYYAKGNCDFEREMQEEQILQVGELTFIVTHGHLYQVKMTLIPLSYRAEEVGAQVACFGHSHIAGAEKVGDTLFINPGSARLPRDRKEPTYAILEWDSLKQVRLQFYHINGEHLPDLSMTTELAVKN
ncbi:hypothetical protein SAMN05192559_10231 [Halobacillus karajensis]|uniref:Phosphoesterase n=1 Tax=Halobacillus karajensis TaxID=195088 RepID=A0A024P724_9BACI|nr:metallophosphoesterase [Halobacillus karajensis]CDQ18221.1 hypothetical protein BN982_00478 [Halobacillus karajensis]CDQ24573.1 hypothetical protein BN983_02864 [Halobacillus karajensis]CDQ29180.1 hypothetical protein BN981_03544 [Halobacillus karajensis]SEH56940.1 hypothetical protein SAMN05192559_10231 [Halobacillus karajensis]